MPDLGRILDLLERDEALDLMDDQQPDFWPPIEDDDVVLEVDHGRLFPTRRPVDRGQQDFEVFGDEWDLRDDDAESVLGPSRNSSPGAPPEWDVWAWYQPIHFFGPRWGIFIREVGMLECARRVGSTLPPWLRSTHRPSLLAKALVRAAFSALFLHEQYHHKTESFAIRLHVVERRPVYPTYHRDVYRRTAGTASQIEEGLANADSWFRVAKDPYARWMGRTITRATKDYLDASFSVATGGYANAVNLLTPFDFEAEQHELFVQVQDGTTPARATPSEFGIATHINRSLFTVTQRIWTVVPAGGRSVLPTHAPIAPLKTRRLERFIKLNGWVPVPGAGKGSHRKFRDATGRMIILPESKDVSLPVLRTTSDTLGMSIRDLEAMAR